MAAVTPSMPTGSTDPLTSEHMTGGLLQTFGTSTIGPKHLTLPFLENDAIDGGDTYTPLGTATNYDAIGIIRAAWEGATSGDECAVTITDATTSSAAYVTFNASTDDIEGYLHLWITN